jgi:hypothetical protein
MKDDDTTAAAEGGQSTGVADLPSGGGNGLGREPLSPELALIDPELAERARARLPDANPAGPTTRPERVLRARARRLPEVAPDSTRAPSFARRHRRILAVLLVALAGGATLGAFLPANSTRQGSSARLEPAAPATTARPAATRTTATAAPPPTTTSRATGTAAAPTNTTPARRTRPSAPITRPRASQPRRAAPAATASRRTFVWAPARGARGYEVEFFRGNSRVFVARTQRARLSLPSRWRYRGRAVRLTPGAYRWQVWALRRQGSRVVRGKAIVQARLVIPR